MSLLVQQQENDFAVWADVQAGMLHDEQQGMRQKAEQRWQQLDEAMAAQQRAREQQGAAPACCACHLHCACCDSPCGADV